MADRPKFFDDLAGVAGGAFSALAGLREEAESLVRARVDETIRKLDLVKREDMEAVGEIAANARAGQEAAEARIAALEARLAKLEAAAGPTPAPEPALRPADLSPDGTEAPPAALPPAAGVSGASPNPAGLA